MQTRLVYLENSKRKEIQIYDGFANFNSLVTTLQQHGVSQTDYYIVRFYNMLYAFSYNGWNEFVVGREEMYYLNPDFHFCKRKIHNGQFNWPYSKEEIEDKYIPETHTFGIFDDLYRIDNNISIYYFDDGWKSYSPQNGLNELRNIICEFGKFFYKDFFFSRIEVHMYLTKYFDKDFLQILDQFYANGAFMVNPFTRRATIDVTGDSVYCSFYDTIADKPICEFGGKTFELKQYNY